MTSITYGYVLTSLLRLKSVNVRLSRDCAGLQINDETMARCRSFSLITEVKARAPLEYRNCFNPLVSWCIGTIVVGIMKRRGRSSATDARTSHVERKAAVVPLAFYK
jgi:hypothetical protein